MCSSGPFVHVCIYINIVDLITIGRIEKIQNQKMCEKGVGDSQGIAKTMRTCGLIEWSGFLPSKFLGKETKSAIDRSRLVVARNGLSLIKANILPDSD